MGDEGPLGAWWSHSIRHFLAALGTGGKQWHGLVLLHPLHAWRHGRNVRQRALNMIRCAQASCMQAPSSVAPESILQLQVIMNRLLDSGDINRVMRCIGL